MCNRNCLWKRYLVHFAEHATLTCSLVLTQHLPHERTVEAVQGTCIGAQCLLHPPASPNRTCRPALLHAYRAMQRPYARQSILVYALICIEPLRLQEYKEAARASEETGIELIPNESNIFVWRGLLKVRVRCMLAACSTKLTAVAVVVSVEQLEALTCAGSEGHTL